MKFAKVAKVVASIGLIASMTACGSNFDYTGTATVKNAFLAKNLCTVKVELEDGTTKNLHLVSIKCYDYDKGETVTIENGKLVD